MPAHCYCNATGWQCAPNLTLVAPVYVRMNCDTGEFLFRVDQAVLEDIRQAMSADTEITVTLVSYTNAEAGAESEAEQRAELVRKRLVDLGIPALRLPIEVRRGKPSQGICFVAFELVPMD